MEDRSLIPDSSFFIDAIYDDKFQNWAKCVLAQNETKKALCEVVERKWKSYMSQMTEEERIQIETFVQCLKNDKIHNLKADPELSCTHEVCKMLSQRLTNLRHIKPAQNAEETLHVPSADACFQYYWDLAKLYLFTEDDRLRAGLKGLDISYLSGMMSNCQLFAFDDCLKNYDNIRQDRDELFHSAENHISDMRMTIVLENMLNLLSNFDGSRFPICKDIVSDIQQLKEKHIQDEYHSFEYKLLVRKCLEDKVAALQLDLSLGENQPMQDLLKETENLLLQVNENITEEDFDEMTELQAEVGRLKETIKVLENERTLEAEKMKKKIKDLEMERDVLQSGIKEMEEQYKKFKQLVDVDIDIKDLQFIASIVETKEEFLLSLEVLPLALTEVGKGVFENELQETLLDPFEIADAQDKLEGSLHTISRYYSEDTDTMQRIQHLITLAREHRKTMVDCFRDSQPFHEMELIIQMTKVATKLKMSGILTLFLRHYSSLLEKYINQLKELRNSYYMLKYKISEEENTFREKYTGYYFLDLQRGKNILTECYGTMKTILCWSEDASARLVQICTEKDNVELFLEFICDADFHEDILESISTVENSLAKFYRFCQIYAEL